MKHAFDKKYFYLRDQQRCFYCQKPLRLAQATLDHYLPRALGGTYDAFNLVLSCKRCNLSKGAKLPADTQEVHLALLKQQARDGRLGVSVSKLTPRDITRLIEEATAIIYEDQATLCVGPFGRLWIKEDRVFRFEMAPKSAVLSWLLVPWLTLLLSLSLMTGTSYASELPKALEPLIVEAVPIVSLERPLDYSAKNLEGLCRALAKRYPEWVRLIEIGRSVDHKPILSLVLTAAENNLESDTYLKHYLLEAGLHAREVVNPVSLLYTVEQYLRDTENNQVLKDIDVARLLEDNVLHVIPLSNPDGFNLAKFGLRGLDTEAARIAFKAVGLTPDPRTGSYPYLKANARGVDLNRNFEDTFFKLKTQQWISIWNVKQNAYYRSQPSHAFYAGPTPNSEPETLSLYQYMTRYPFTAVVSLHSKGEVIYWRYWMHSDSYNALCADLARKVSAITGYRLMSGDSEDASSGYMGDVVANVLHRPFLTLETTNQDTPYQSPSPALYRSVVKEIRDIPALLMDWGERQKPSPYWLYVDSRYVRSYDHPVIAKAMAIRLGGALWTPKPHESEFKALGLDEGLLSMDRPINPPAVLGTWISWKSLVQQLDTLIPARAPWPLPNQNSANPVKLKDLGTYLTLFTGKNLNSLLEGQVNEPTAQILSDDGEYLSHYGIIPLVRWILD